MGDKTLQGAIVGVVLLVVGSLSGRSSPIVNRANNTVYINSKSLESSDTKNIKSGVSETFEKLNINTATLQQFRDLHCGIGAKKYEKIIQNRPFHSLSELREKHILGYYSYRKVKKYFTARGY